MTAFHYVIVVYLSDGIFRAVPHYVHYNHAGGHYTLHWSRNIHKFQSLGVAYEVATSESERMIKSMEGRLPSQWYWQILKRFDDDVICSSKDSPLELLAKMAGESNNEV